MKRIHIRNNHDDDDDDDGMAKRQQKTKNELEKVRSKIKHHHIV